MIPAPSPPIAKALVAALAAFACALALAPAAPALANPAPARQPNVIVFNSDDQPASTFTPEHMPVTFKRIVDRGTEFTEFVVSTPLCCPSRAVLATGQYGHNNGVLRNIYGRLREKRNVLPRWLQRAGYKTIHVGRFFNGYEGGGRESEIPSGWNIWKTLLLPRQYYDYAITLNQGERLYGQGEDEHLTKVLSRLAARVVARRATRRRPFFLQLDYLAPHVGRGIEGQACDGAAVPAPEDEGRYRSAPLPRGPSFNEADLSDKPAFLQSLPAMSPWSVAATERSWRCLLRSVRSLDRGVGQVLNALRQGGATKDTLLIFTSDNGLYNGEHRIADRKHYPFEEGLRVPFAMRLPARDFTFQRATSGAPVGNVDIVATILGLADGEPCLRDRCRTLDGRSLVAEALMPGVIPRDRAITVGYDQPGPRDGLVCGYTGLRSLQETYILHFRTRQDEDGECVDDAAIEHYDRTVDPFQLENLFPAAAGSELEQDQAALFDRIVRLSDCAGISGRDPLPESGNYCE